MVIYWSQNVQVRLSLTEIYETKLTTQTNGKDTTDKEVCGCFLNYLITVFHLQCKIQHVYVKKDLEEEHRGHLKFGPAMMALFHKH